MSRRKRQPAPRRPESTEQSQARELAASQQEFQDLKAKCGPDEMVCGTVRPDGRPVYFLAPRDLPDEQLEERAFTARHGRGRYPGEIVLAQMAAKHTAGAEA